MVWKDLNMSEHSYNTQCTVSPMLAWFCLIYKMSTRMLFSYNWYWWGHCLQGNLCGHEKCYRECEAITVCMILKFKWFDRCLVYRCKKDLMAKWVAWKMFAMAVRLKWYYRGPLRHWRAHFIDKVNTLRRPWLK